MSAPLEPKIIYENENFLAIEKPAGLVVHGAKGRRAMSYELGATSVEPTVVDWLLKHRSEVAAVGDDPTTRPGIVHRLDKETSGLMLIPKTQDYFEYLKSLFKEHKIQKTYHAVVRGVPKLKEGVIDAPIGIVNGTLKRSVRSTKMQKDAVTEYRVLRGWREGEEEVSLLEVRPKTGRTHQIRVHLASMGHPIVGDPLYGSRHSSKLIAHNSLHLHASSLEFPDRDGSVIRLSTEPPFVRD